MTIGARIRDRRKELRLTLDDVSAKTGVPKSTIQRWESGAITNMGQERLRKVAEALETTVAYLQTGVSVSVKTYARQEPDDQDVFDYLCRKSGYSYATHLGPDRYYSDSHGGHVLADEKSVHEVIDQLVPYFGYLLHARSMSFEDFYRLLNGERNS